MLASEKPELREALPRRKKKNFRKLVELPSASNWTDFELDRFGGRFVEDTYDPLPPEVLSYWPDDILEDGNKENESSNGELDRKQNFRNCL